MAERPNSWAEVIRAAIDARIGEVHTAIPGKVVRVNMAGANIRSVDVQPLIQRAHIDEDEKRVAETMPVIPSVPVAFPSAGDYRVTFPIAVGSTGVILFSEASLDVWLAKGGTVDPGDDRRCSLADGIFLPGLRSLAESLGSVPADRMTVGDDGGLQIHIDKASIRLGDNAAIDAVIKGTDHFTKLNTFLNAVIALGGAGAALTAAPTSEPLFLATFPVHSAALTALASVLTSLLGVATTFQSSLNASLSTTVKVK